MCDFYYLLGMDIKKWINVCIFNGPGRDHVISLNSFPKMKFP